MSSPNDNTNLNTTYCKFNCFGSDHINKFAKKIKYQNISDLESKVKTFLLNNHWINKNDSISIKNIRKNKNTINSDIYIHSNSSFNIDLPSKPSLKLDDPDSFKKAMEFIKLLIKRDHSKLCPKINVLFGKKPQQVSNEIEEDSCKQNSENDKISDLSIEEEYIRQNGTLQYNNSKIGLFIGANNTTAIIRSLGILSIIKEKNLLDKIQYFCGQSFGNILLALLFKHNFDIEQIENLLKTATSNKNSTNLDNVAVLSKLYKDPNFLYQQFIKFIASLDSCMNLELSKILDLHDEKMKAIPIFLGASLNSEKTSNKKDKNYDLLEMTPFHCFSYEDQFYIKIQDLLSKFENGKMIEKSDELKLFEIFIIFSGGLAYTPNECKEFYTNDFRLHMKSIRNKEHIVAINGKEMNIKSGETVNKTLNEESMKLYNASIRSKLNLEALIRRGCDVIFVVCDFKDIPLYLDQINDENNKYKQFYPESMRSMDVNKEKTCPINIYADKKIKIIFINVLLNDNKFDHSLMNNHVLLSVEKFYNIMENIKNNKMWCAAFDSMIKLLEKNDIEKMEENDIK